MLGRYREQQERLDWGGLTHVVAPTMEGLWVEMNQKNNMEAALATKLTDHFSQSKNTTVLQQPLLDEVGHMGYGPA